MKFGSWTYDGYMVSFFFVLAKIHFLYTFFKINWFFTITTFERILNINNRKAERRNERKIDRVKEENVIKIKHNKFTQFL